MKKITIIILSVLVFCFILFILLTSRWNNKNTDTNSNEEITQITSNKSNNDNNANESSYVKIAMDSSFILKTDIDNSFKMKKPAGILINDDYILICSQNSHSIIKYSLNGSFINEVGQLGSAPGEFNTPTGITMHNNIIYVVDAYNNRVQLFDEQLNYLSQIDLPNFADQNYSYFFDIAIDGDEEIFVASNTMRGKEKLIHLNQDGTYEVISDNFYGFINCYNGVIYGIDYMECYINGENYGAQSGKSGFYKIQDMKLKQITELPYANSFLDFEIKDELIYCYNGAFSRLDCFDMQGNYISTLAKFPAQDIISDYIAITADNNIYVTSTEQNEVYQIIKVGE